MPLSRIFMSCSFYTGDQDGHEINIQGPKDFAGCITSARKLVEEKDKLWVSSLVTEGMGAAKACLGGEIVELQIDEVRERE